MRNLLWKQPGLDRLIGVLVASIALFLVEIVMSHITHSLTLLVAAYHMLYNIFSLIGCIATIKMCQRGSSVSNTFGWARLEVLSTVVNLLFLSALDFSLVVEAIQTLIHLDHMDSMHQPEIICIVAGVGILFNCICILLIGGFTHHQGSFLALTPGGDVFVQHGVATEDAVRKGLRRLATTDRSECAGGTQDDIQESEIDVMMPQREELDTRTKGVIARVSQRWPTMYAVLRDNASTVIALVSAVVVYMNGESLTSLLIDPILTLVSVAILVFTSYPFIIQAGQILLQTTPAHIDVGELKSKLKETFPSVVGIHDLHVWALTPDRVISTAHLVFTNENVYLRVKKPINDFFLGQGITRVTLQPEFNKFGILTPAQSKNCVLTCNNELCKSRTCCNYERATSDVVPVEDVESPAQTQDVVGMTTETPRVMIVVDHSEVSPQCNSTSSIEHQCQLNHQPISHITQDSCSTECESNSKSTKRTSKMETADHQAHVVSEKNLNSPD
ncbi:proton-coupled zinc antiporter SLC30A1-like [Daphnia carinata]|uniref:proton-coupled zinc antiporter SLC30A1-like n=1 Tax=Daphnia carinata TaxID=120202 RepID=UPI00257D8027|nr:proton-coupled zinc antiporter SLC30A1-like [Daphnia carinata]